MLTLDHIELLPALIAASIGLAFALMVAARAGLSRLAARSAAVGAIASSARWRVAGLVVAYSVGALVATQWAMSSLASTAATTGGILGQMMESHAAVFIGFALLSGIFMGAVAVGVLHVLSLASAWPARFAFAPRSGAVTVGAH